MERLRIWRVCLAAVISVGCAAHADDTELYVLESNASGQLRPQVLVLFDNSGSMDTEEAVAAEPFDPSRDYTGSGSNRIFFVRGSVSVDNYPDPRNSREWRWFYPQNNACARSLLPHPSDASKSILQHEGRFTSNVRYFRRRNRGRSRWDELPNNGRDANRLRASVVECAADLDTANATNAPEASSSDFRGSGFPQDGNRRQPFDGTAVGASQSAREAAAANAYANTRFGQGDAVTLFTENYLTYLKYFQQTTQRQRIAIARDTITSLINATPGVDFGLQVFNRNWNTPGRYRNDDGGRITAGIQEMTDSNRSRLINIVNGLETEAWTPLCESLFEAYRYYSGGAVLGGTKGAGLSPPADTSIISGSRYESPMRRCQPQSYVIVITDGEPTLDNNFDSLVQSELGLGEADKFDGNYLSELGYYQGRADKFEGSYLPAVAGWMRQNDVNPDLQGTQNVVTYTIGFSRGAADAAALLEETAARGGGQYYSAETALALQASLQQIFSEILAVNASFTSPSIAANSFDRTRTLDAIYYAMFLPSDRPRWTGNLKKLRIASDGRVVDGRGALAIDAGGNIADGACTFWTSTSVCARASSSGDGNDVTIGGALEHVLQRTNRRLLTNPAGTSGALTDMDRDALTSAVGSEADLLSAIGVADSGLLDDFVRWLEGRDVDDEDEDGNRSDMRVDAIGDPLHSKPLALSYGSSGGVRILMGTNHGYLHMFQDNGDSITENWAYYLPDMLPTLKALRENAQTGGHSEYGVDGSVSAYVYDADADGNIESGSDKVWAFFGLRRGGRAYYALDITNPDQPSLMWSVNAATPGMSELGQSWAEPVVTTIPGRTDPVVILSGGYDTNKDADGVGTPDSMGRAVFFLDAESGQLLHRFSAEGAAGANVTPWNVTDSIAAKVTPMDSDGDSVTDRLYVADTGANIWRIDMPSADTSSWSAMQFASLGGNLASSDRRFFGEVAVAQTTFSLVSTVTVDNGGEDVSVNTTEETPYDAVLVGSGDRTNPNGRGTQNYLFALQDRKIRTQTFGASGNPAPAPITLADLLNVESDPFANANSETALLSAQLALGQSRGWYLPLDLSEKSVSAPTLISGIAYFTTFRPASIESTDACLEAGEGFLYALSLQEGMQLSLFSLGSRLPDTPQILVPPPGASSIDDWSPSLHLVGVGPGEDNTGTIATEQRLVPQRIYYQYGD